MSFFKTRFTELLGIEYPIIKTSQQIEVDGDAGIIRILDGAG